MRVLDRDPTYSTQKYHTKLRKSTTSIRFVGVVRKVGGKPGLLYCCYGGVSILAQGQAPATSPARAVLVRGILRVFYSIASSLSLILAPGLAAPAALDVVRVRPDERTLLCAFVHTSGFS